MSLAVDWYPPGPVTNRFMGATSFVQAIQGPIGSGKTTACFVKLIYLAFQQQPSVRDGVRRFKACVVRDTYRDLWRTTIPSWWKLVPQSMGTWTGGRGEPAQHHLIIDGGGKRLEFTLDFVAIGDGRAEDVLRGYEVTVFYLNEFDLLNEEVYLYVRGRAGRYPLMIDGGPTFWGVLADLNAPDVDSWAYKMLYDDQPEDVSLFVQPSGLAPNAENKANLPAGYYEKQVVGQPAWYIRRMIENKPGYSRSGAVVYTEWNDPLHCASADLVFVPQRTLFVGLDAGGTPAATIWQRGADGQWRGLDELVSPAGEITGPNRFGQRLSQMLTERFPGADVRGIADPSAAYGTDRQDEDEEDWIQTVARVARIPVRAAVTNSSTVRREAIRVPLTQMIDGHKPGLIISPRMTRFRRAMNSDYRYRRYPGPVERYDTVPEKNDASHVVDAAQYAILGGSDYAELTGREQRRSQNAGRRLAYAGDENSPDGIDA